MTLILFLSGFAFAQNQSSVGPRKHGESQVRPALKRAQRPFVQPRNRIREMAERVDPRPLDLRGGKACRYASLCEELGKNRNKAILYDDGKQGIIRNQALIRLDKAVTECFKRHLWKNVAAIRKEASNLKPGILFTQKEKVKKLAQLTLEFRNSMSPDEKKAYEKLKDYLLKKIASGKEAISLPSGTPTSATLLNNTEQYRNVYLYDFRMALKEAKITNAANRFPFDQDTMNKYADYMVTYESKTSFKVTPIPGVSRIIPLPTARIKDSDKLIRRAENTFERARTKMLDYLKEKKKRLNDPSIENLIQRIRTVRFEPNSIFPGTFYYPAGHSISCTPEYLEKPQTTLMTVFLHELSHAIDPCVSTGTLVELEKKGPKGEKSYTNIVFEDRRSPKGKIAAAPIHASLYPFKNNLDCLELSVGANRISPADGRRILNTAIKTARGRGNESYLKILESQSKNVEEFILNKGACIRQGVLGIGGPSQISEAFSDFMAAEVVEREIAQLPTKKEQARFAVESTLHLMNHCSTIKPSNGILIMKKLEKLGCTRTMSAKNLTEKDYEISLNFGAFIRSDEHPESSQRFNRIGILPPKIRKALDCPKRKKGERYCG